MQRATKKNKKNWAAAALACLLCVSLISLTVDGFAQITPQASASIIRNFARVSFTTPVPLKLHSAGKGRQIRLRFDQPIEVNPAPLLQKLKPYVISISQSEDKRSLLLTTNREYRTRSFVSGNSAGVDIIGLQEGGVQTAEPPAPEKPTAKPAAKAKEVEKVAEKPRPLAAVKPNIKPVVPITAPESKPVEKQPEPTPVPVPTAVVEEQTSPVPVPEPLPTSKEEEPIPQPAPVPVVEAEPEPQAAIQEEEDVEMHKEPPQAAAPVASVQVAEPATPLDANSIHVEKTEEGVALTFPWDKRTAAAVFRRGDRTLVLFSDQKAFSAKAARNDPNIRTIDSVLIGGKQPAQLWTINTPLNGVRATRIEKSYNWRIELTNEEVIPAHLLKPQPMADTPLRPHLFIPALELSMPIKVIDPLLGDELTVIPFFESDTGLVPPRSFPEFSLLRTAEGLAITDAMPQLRIARTRNGLKITAPGGILISKDLPPVQLPEQEIVDSEASDSFFPYQNWLEPSDEARPADFEDKLWRQIATEDKKKRRVAWKRLAEFYLAHGRAMEAKTVLGILAQDEPIYFTRNKLHAMLGAAHFLAYEFPEAETAFKNPTVEKEEELNLWRETLGVLLRGDGDPDYIAYHDKYIRHYPPMMRQRLALVAADHYINQKKYNKALKIFDTLHKDAMLEDVQDHVQFLIGRVLAGTTQKDAARLMWQKLAEKTDNAYIRPRALFAITNLNLSENKISVEEAIQQLEPLRIMWRGDRFEVSLLTLLTRLYEEAGKYREALRAYREIITYFPNNPDNIEMTGKMADIFRKLFNEGEADKLPPLQALALYYEFRNLTPIGEEGDRMIQNLADRLTAVELLDRAASLLQHQVEFRLSGEERSRVGARLALIHLLQRKPKDALNVLELTGYGGNPPSLQHQRTLLTARALMGLDESKRALALLAGDDSLDARLLALSIEWKDQRWPEMIQIAEKLLSERVDPSQPLNKTETDVLMKLAIGYVFEKQRGQLQYLRDYFLPLVKDKESQDLFSFITEDTPLDYRNINKLTSQIGRMESFLANYREKIKKEGLSKAVE